MCSGCSGDYEADGEAEEILRDSSMGGTEGIPADSSAGRDHDSHHNENFGVAPIAAGPAGFWLSPDEFDVFVSDERIVEVRRVGRISPGLRYPRRHSSGESANRYETRGRNEGRDAGGLEVALILLNRQGLSVFERFSQTVRRLLR